MGQHFQGQTLQDLITLSVAENVPQAPLFIAGRSVNLAVLENATGNFC